MKKLFKYFNLNQVGLLEILLALYPILVAYRYGALYLSHIVLLLLDVVIIIKSRKGFLRFTPLLLLLIYYIIHQFIDFAVFGLTQSYNINSTISELIFLFSLFIITPAINFEKFEGSINLVSIFCLVGLFYHAVLAAQGQTITPIQLPFLPTPDVSQTRLFGEGLRPKSFFMEPQSYVSYMIFTLFFAVRKQKYVWAVLVGLSIILSTSTTGLAMIPVMMTLFVFLGKSKWYKKIFMGVILVGLALFFFNSKWASMGLEKLESTELSENSRTANGIILASKMTAGDMIIGVPYASATDYFHSSDAAGANVFVDNAGGVFISGFWQALIFYGIIGLLLYLNIYWSILKKKREIIPILGCLVVAMFSNPDFIGAYWTFSMMFLISFVNNTNNLVVEKNKRILTN